MYRVIFICESSELVRGIVIFAAQVIVFLNQDKFNQLPTGSQPETLFPHHSKDTFFFKVCFTDWQ